MLSKIKKAIKKIPFSEKARKFIRRTINPPILYFMSGGTLPLSDYHGFDRGTPTDRFYIENFLKQNKQYVHGVCLELLNNNYTIKYGNGRVTKSDVLDIDEKNIDATIIDDLRRLKKVNDNTYDCIILTQVFQFIDDVPSAIDECYRILKPRGALLVTLPSLSRIDPISGIEGDFWRFTEASAKYLFRKKFSEDKVTVSSHGNVRSGMYFYAGLSSEDASNNILKKDDKDFPLIVTVIAIK